MAILLLPFHDISRILARCGKYAIFLIKLVAQTAIVACLQLDIFICLFYCQFKNQIIFNNKINTAIS